MYLNYSLLANVNISLGVRGVREKVFFLFLKIKFLKIRNLQNFQNFIFETPKNLFLLTPLTPIINLTP
jgi:hypothetical protein